ncbi:MAG: tetratricopeptide repeat protein [Myxococcota bacterium]|nr:tetratricopeptide repeat protein [Myxococcota bacterium]
MGSQKLLLIVLASLVVGTSSRLSEASEDKNLATAKAAYIEGQRLFQAEEYELALPYFEKAYITSNKKPSTVLGFAQCLRMLKRYDEAIEKFEEYLVTPEGKAESERVTETLKILRTQSKQSAELKEKQQKEEQAKEEERQKREEKRARELALSLVPPPTTVKVIEKESAMSPWIWVGLGVLIAGLGASAAAVGIANQGDDTVYEGSFGKVLRP